MKIKILTIFTLIVFITVACNNKNNDNSENSNNNGVNDVKDSVVVKVNNPLNVTFSEPKKDKHILGDKIEIIVDVKDITEEDSITLIINDKEEAVLSQKNMKYVWDSKASKTGTNIVEARLKRGDNQFQKQRRIVFLSDVKPKEYTYKVKKVYKHDEAAYTQGLFYHDGYLYEATGLKGESTVRKVKLETGEVFQSFAIPKDVFGEGIVFLDNKIIQLSWEAGKGFVYDIDNFKLINQFSYTGQGWGIGTDGENLFMTNGTNKIQILEKQSYSITGELEVYDDEGEVKLLNELEYIDGEIYANIYQYEKIARIDPKTGKVNSYINLKGILPMKDVTRNTDVLNGIAYDKKGERIFVTGKKWPKLFEIELIEK